MRRTQYRYARNLIATTTEEEAETLANFVQQGNSKVKPTLSFDKDDFKGMVLQNEDPSLDFVHITKTARVSIRLKGVGIITGYALAPNGLSIGAHRKAMEAYEECLQFCEDIWSRVARLT